MKPFFLRTSLLVSLPVLLLFCAHAILAQDSVTSNASARERLFLDRGWLFHEGDIPFPVVIGHGLAAFYPIADFVRISACEIGCLRIQIRTE
jgi:hypothetical protein